MGTVLAIYYRLKTYCCCCKKKRQEVDGTEVRVSMPFHCCVTVNQSEYDTSANIDNNESNRRNLNG